MQSDKKHRRESNPKMLASEFAIPYANNVEDIKRAIANAQRYESVSRDAATRHTDRFEKKNSLNIANFWANVQGILNKHQRSLQGKK